MLYIIQCIYNVQVSRQQQAREAAHNWKRSLSGGNLLTPSDIPASDDGVKPASDDGVKPASDDGVKPASDDGVKPIVPEPGGVQHQAVLARLELGLSRHTHTHTHCLTD